ncbi:MAG: PEF-CTERM sorting domain-containing protein [Thermodesulfobacteriota bacterium]|nr:PEF-CTERM sorting domain-containing protein [Thermodesulfobacteriota bacterium]
MLIGENEGVSVAYENTAPPAEPIPEFSTIAIPVATILGIFFLFSRNRKQKKQFITRNSKEIERVELQVKSSLYSFLYFL